MTALLDPEHALPRGPGPMPVPRPGTTTLPGNLISVKARGYMLIMGWQQTQGRTAGRSTQSTEYRLSDPEPALLRCGPPSSCASSPRTRARTTSRRPAGSRPHRTVPCSWIEWTTDPDVRWRALVGLNKREAPCAQARHQLPPTRRTAATQPQRGRTTGSPASACWPR